MTRPYNPRRESNSRFAQGPVAAAKPVDPQAASLAATPPTLLNESGFPAPVDYGHMSQIVRERTQRDFPVPVITWNEVTHIGTLNAEDRASWSLEGEGLSVSINPEEWEEIAKLGGRPHWRIATDRPLRFVDAHKLTSQARNDIAQWGVENGIVERVTTYTATWYDSEMDSDLSMVCNTREEAEDQVNWDISDADNDDGSSIEETSHLQFTKDYPRRGADLGNVEDLLIVEWAMQHENVDGVWWNDNLDPANYSAPRGVLLSTRLSEYSYTEA